MLVGLWALAHAATFVVDDVGAGEDDLPGDGVCATVDGTCTLVAAVAEAEATVAADRIELPEATLVLPEGVSFQVTAPLEVVGMGRARTELVFGDAVTGWEVQGTDFRLEGVTLSADTVTRSDSTGVRAINVGVLALTNVRIEGFLLAGVATYRSVEAATVASEVVLEKVEVVDVESYGFRFVSYEGVEPGEHVVTARSMVAEDVKTGWSVGGPLRWDLDGAWFGSRSGVVAPTGVYHSGASGQMRDVRVLGGSTGLRAYGGTLDAVDVRIEGAPEGNDYEMLALLGVGGVLDRFVVVHNHTTSDVAYISTDVPLVIERSVFFRNVAGGAGLNMYGSGLEVRNVLVARNRTGGAAVNAIGEDIRFEHMSIVYNHATRDFPSVPGGIATIGGPGGGVSLSWSVVAGNRVLSNRGPVDECWGYFLSGGPNFVAGMDGTTCVFDGPQPLAGTPEAPLDPRWHILEIGDGIYAPEPDADSPLVDAAVGSLIADDLAGRPRPRDGDGDGGAVPDLGVAERQGL